MKTKDLVITKRKTSRTLQVPDYGDNSWRAREYPAKHFRFYDDRTEYTRGKLSITFNLDGKAIEGWSYWTCIFCYAEPTDDFPQGRLIYNASGYGSTTGKHIGDMRGFFSSPSGSYTGPVMRREYSRIDKVIRVIEHAEHTYTGWDGTQHTSKAWTQKITRPTRAYTSKLVRHATPGSSVIEQICWGRGATPSGMREKVRLDARTPAQVAADAQAAIDAAKARELRYAAMEAEWLAADAKRAAEREAREAATPKLTLVQGGM